MEQTFAPAMQWLDILYKIWPIFCILAVALIVFFRTRSLYFLFYRIFSLLGLEGKYSNIDDQKVSDDLLDLNKFNLKTGLRLESVKAKVRLHKWMRENDFEVVELRSAGQYFKVNELRFEILDRGVKWMLGVGTLIVSILCLLCAQLLLTPDKALLKVKATGTWFWASENNEANSFWNDAWEIFRGDEWSIQPYHCRYIDGAKPLKNSWDKNVICTLVLGFDDDYVPRTIRSQKNMGAAVGIFGIVILVILVWYAKWQINAHRLNDRLSKKLPNDSSSQGQAENPDQHISYGSYEWGGLQYGAAHSDAYRVAHYTVSITRPSGD